MAKKKLMALQTDEELVAFAIDQLQGWKAPGGIRLSNAVMALQTIFQRSGEEPISVPVPPIPPLKPGDKITIPRPKRKKKEKPISQPVNPTPKPVKRIPAPKRKKSGK